MPASVAESPRRFHFGPYELDVRAGELRKNGLTIKLQKQPLQILKVLLERPGEVITREELRNQLWPADTFVDFDHSLNTAVKGLREVLGDSEKLVSPGCNRGRIGPILPLDKSAGVRCSHFVRRRHVSARKVGRGRPR